MVHYEVPDSLLLLPTSSPPALPPREVINNNSTSRLSRADVVPRKPNARIGFSSECASYFKFAICNWVICFSIAAGLLYLLYHFEVVHIKKPEVLSKDPCPPDYLLFPETNSCYKANSSTVLFEEGEADCQKVGAHLTSILSEKENIFIAGLYQDSIIHSHRSDAHSFWIGLTRTNEKRDWEWLDGSKREFINWRHTEEHPDHSELWSFMKPQGLKWYRTRGSKKGYVCKKPSMISLDGLASSANSFLCPPDFHYFKSSACYKYIDTPTTYENATQNCKNRNAHLASVHSKLESVLLRGLVETVFPDIQDTTPGHNVWLGLTYKDNKYQWSDGSSYDYEEWRVSESNQVRGFDYALMPYWRAWENRKPDEMNGYICKI